MTRCMTEHQARFLAHVAEVSPGSWLLSVAISPGSWLPTVAVSPGSWSPEAGVSPGSWLLVVLWWEGGMGTKPCYHRTGF